MFPLEFPFKKLAAAGAADWVLDPFCGRGTTNFAARLRGLPSVGLDSNPVAAAIASSKFVKAAPEAVVRLCRVILGGSDPRRVPEGRFWELAYGRKTLVDMCKIRESLLRDRSTEDRTALLALVLGILHGPRRKGVPTYLSNQMPRTYATKPEAAIRFWNKHRMRPFEVDVLDAVSRRAWYSFSDVPPRVAGGIYQADSREAAIPVAGDGFSFVVTSPPYPGMRTYRPDQWLRAWFLGGPDTVDYEQDGQLPHTKGEDKFVSELARVWKNAAGVCRPGARLAVRFGALPSHPVDPKRLLRRSLEIAACGWRVTTVRIAGHAADGRRQAEQFNRKTGEPVEEIDLHAVLED